MHRIDLNRRALNSFTLGASNDVSTTIVRHIFNVLGGSESQKSWEIVEISTGLIHQDELIFGVLRKDSRFTHKDASYGSESTCVQFI